MAAYENTFQIPARTWVLLTPSGAVAAASLQCQGPYDVHVVANQSGAVPPANIAGSMWLRPSDGTSADRPLTALRPGALGAGTTAYLWAYSEAASSISVSHA